MSFREEIKSKYGNFWDAVYSDRETFEREYMTESYLYIATEWREFGVTLIEVNDNNMWCEIVVIE